MSLSNPQVTVNIVPGGVLQSIGDQRVLIVGQMDVAQGTATPGDLVSDIQNDESWDTLFGKNSFIAAYVRGFKKLNQFTKVSAIPLQDGGGSTPASGTFTFTGTATAAGSFVVTVGSSVNHTYTVPVAIGDTGTDIALNLISIMGFDQFRLWTLSTLVNVLTVTSVNAGPIGNGITLKVTGSASGVVPTMSPMVAGAVNPTLTNVFDVVGSIRFQTVVSSSAYGISFLSDFLDPRFNAVNDVLDGEGILTFTDTFANLNAQITVQNTATIVPLMNNLVAESLYAGSALLEIDGVISSYFAADRSLRLTENSNIAHLNVSPEGLNDNIGGPAQASKPYMNMPFPPNILPLIDSDKEFSDTEVSQLLAAGGSVLGNNRARNSIIAGQIVTTYKTDSTFKFLNFVDTSSVIREAFFNGLKAAYASSRLTEGDLIPFFSMANENSIKAKLDGIYVELSTLTLTVAGNDAKAFFKENRQVFVDAPTGTVTIFMKVPIVVQLREIIAEMQVVFDLSTLQG